MKNIITFITLAVIGIFTIVKPDYCLSENDVATSTPYIQAPNLFEGCECVNYAYRYVSVGVGPIVFIPNVGIGYRERYSKYGWDTSINFSTIGYAHQLSGNIVGHYYLNPLKTRSPYLGLGIMGSGIISNRGKGGVTLSPDFVFGKEISRTGDSRHFIEMHVAVPSMWVDSKHVRSMNIPLMFIKYGIAF